MKTSLEWAGEVDRRMRETDFAWWEGRVQESVLAEVIREAMNEARQEVIEAMRHVDHITPGYVGTMMEGNDGT